MIQSLRTMLLTFAAVGVAACASVESAPVQTPAPGPARFDEAIAAFETADKASPPPKCATLFVGSSTIRRWASLKEDFADRTVINRGFGGSTVWEVDHYFNRVVAPLKPKEIVFYAGDNDLGATPPRSPETVYADFVHILAQKDKALGKTPVYFIAVKPSKLRWAMQDRMSAVNAKVKALAAKRDDLAYIDIVPIMLKPDGTPKDIFVEDNLHMTPEGYALWSPIVDAALDKGQTAKAPGC